MPPLDAHQSNDYVKLLAIGDAKSGKTGSLVSLVKAGYKLRILDFDNLLDILKGMILRECPDMIGNVEFRTLRDKRKWVGNATVIDGAPKAFADGVKMLDNWKYTYEGETIDFGKPSEWGSDTILVIDSLSRFCDSAYDYREPLTPKGAGGLTDGRAIYGDAQDAVENVLAHITSSTYKCNIIVIAHIMYQDQPDGSKKGFPQGVGQKLSPKIPQYFPSVVHYTNHSGKRMIQTNSTPLIDLANPKPFELNKALPLETGLATIFDTCLGKVPTVVPPKATPTLRRTA